MPPPETSADLRAQPFFSKLSAEELATAFALLRPRTLRAHTSLPLGRGFKGKIGFAWSGKLRIIGVSPIGRVITLFPLELGEPFGYAARFHGGVFGPPVKLMADTSGLILEADADTFTDFVVHSPAATRAFFAATSRRLMDYSTRLYELATLDSKTRLCCELLRLSKRGAWSEGKCTLRPRPSREAIATQISIAREAVSRSFKEMSRKGLLSVEGNALVLHDLEALREIVRQNSGAVFVPQPELD